MPSSAPAASSYAFAVVTSPTSKALVSTRTHSCSTCSEFQQRLVESCGLANISGSLTPRASRCAADLRTPSACSPSPPLVPGRPLLVPGRLLLVPGRESDKVVERSGGGRPAALGGRSPEPVSAGAFSPP